MRIKQTLLLVSGLLISPALMAGNTTISDAFDGTEPSMAIGDFSCSAVAKPFKELGTFQVSISGTYEINDGGNPAWVLGDNGPVADVVIMVYNGAFSSADPSANRIAQVDETANVALQAGTNYALVVQYYCERSTYGPVPFAAIIKGDGEVTGAGFDSPFYTFGTFTGASPTALFPGINGVHAYFATSALNFPATGNYVFSDFFALVGSEVVVWVYDGSFDPNNPLNNRVATGSFIESLFLESGKSYIFVLIDVFDFFDEWQFALFPPAAATFNAGLNGAWVINGVGGQGILAEILQNNGLMFFAWFTYIDTPAVIAESGSITQAQDSNGPTRPETHLGSTDQRWLTGFGFLPQSGNIMSINFENSTGGAFDSSFANPSTNNEYGVGSIQLLDCNSMNLSYNLPGGLADTVLFERILPDGAMRCYDLTPQAPIQPPIQ